MYLFLVITGEVPTDIGDYTYLVFFSIIIILFFPILPARSKGVIPLAFT